MGLSVASDPPQYFSAAFELKGSAMEGELTLVSPLGSVMAILTWSSGRASLRAGKEMRRFESLEALTQQTTGTPLPIGAMFDWLEGIETGAEGWRADLSNRKLGRIVATRADPAPAAELRLIVDP